LAGAPLLERFHLGQGALSQPELSANALRRFGDLQQRGLTAALDVLPQLGLSVRETAELGLQLA
jgi:hypothetical protein